MTMENWILFSTIALVATITPGPAVLLVATHSVSYGSTRSLFTILGNISGLFIMSFCSVLGLSMVVLHSAALFGCVKIIGAVYLIYLGVRLWRSGFSFQNGVKRKNSRAAGRITLYTQGLTVALSNPKAIVFTTALFPQFIDHQAPLAPQFALLVGSFMTYSFFCLFLYGRIAATTTTTIQGSPLAKPISRVFATLLIGSGLLLGTSSSR